MATIFLFFSNKQLQLQSAICVLGICWVQQIKDEDADIFNTYFIFFENIEGKKPMKPLQGSFCSSKTNINT